MIEYTASDGKEVAETMGALTSLFHLAIIIHYGYGLRVYLFGLNPPEEILKLKHIGGGPFKYLTFWDMLIQFMFFILAFINDIVGTNTAVSRNQAKLQKIRDFFFSTVVFSCGTFVTLSFWGIYNVDRNLIFPPIFDSWFPHWLNHNVHTTPLIGVLIELYLNPHNFPRRRTGLSVVGVFCLIYLVWVCFIAYQSGHWVYPILAHLSVVGRVIFITSMSVLVSLFYIIGETLNKQVWGAQIDVKKTA
ncbi:hypothetical protein SK128_007574 [Halocaridina rubra]|uniref:Uncharacterized protein n=1 Tax=Halocaridina rubra TaxID=373956 RepID=A0AAN9A4V6_HALRR